MEALLLAALGYGIPAVFLLAGVMILRKREWVFRTSRGGTTRPYVVRGTPLKAVGWTSVLPFIGLLVSLTLAATALAPDQKFFGVGPYRWAPAFSAFAVGVPAYVLIRIIISVSREEPGGSQGDGIEHFC
jgi:hypothetical protein